MDKKTKPQRNKQNQSTTKQQKQMNKQTKTPSKPNKTKEQIASRRKIVQLPESLDIETNNEARLCFACDIMVC